jgi:hypothetical protein
LVTAFSPDFQQDFFEDGFFEDGLLEDGHLKPSIGLAIPDKSAIGKSGK